MSVVPIFPSVNQLLPSTARCYRVGDPAGSRPSGPLAGEEVLLDAVPSLLASAGGEPVLVCVAARGWVRSSLFPSDDDGFYQHTILKFFVGVVRGGIQGSEDEVLFRRHALISRQAERPYGHTSDLLEGGIVSCASLLSPHDLPEYNPFGFDRLVYVGTPAVQEALAWVANSCSRTRDGSAMPPLLDLLAALDYVAPPLIQPFVSLCERELAHKERILAVLRPHVDELRKEFEKQERVLRREEKLRDSWKRYLPGG